MLFSEPKIPQSYHRHHSRRSTRSFQCSSASRKFLNGGSRSRGGLGASVSVLFSEPKIPQCNPDRQSQNANEVSVLFSEPKIPQSWRNSSGDTWWPFQCSSASRKFLNRTIKSGCMCGTTGFSALQRAENSSIPTLAPASIHIPDCDDHASSFLSLPGASP